MKEVSDIERRLRATAVDPGVRPEHYQALRAEIRARYRERRRHRLLTAGCLALFSLVVFREQPLESYSPHFGFYEITDDSTRAVFKTYDDAGTTWTFGSTSDGVTSDVLDVDKALDAKRRLELEIDLFAAGLMELKTVMAYTFRGQTEFWLTYEAEHEGETIDHLEVVDENTDPLYLPFLRNGGFWELNFDFRDGAPSELPKQDIVLDGRVVTFDRRMVHHPEHGGIVLWRSVAVN